uniref:Protein phosphatase 1 regulatory subunit pprA n=1 Tax=Nelumbo nucifera TaxID=4432 RepID=A0A822XVU3_NELNU|nr:TPA_asm: hypothetical protein HUJ06_024579 [Nelumbo nucifera]
MVRFSCFHAHIHYPRSKKAFQQSSATMDKPMKAPSISSSLSAEQVKSSSSVGCRSKSEEMSSFSHDGNMAVHHRVHLLKKSQSLGSGLDREGIVSSSINSDDELDQGFSCDGSQGKNYSEILGVVDRSELIEPFDSRDPEMSLHQEAMVSEPSQANSNLVHNETIFSIGDPQQLEREGHEETIFPIGDSKQLERGHEDSTTQISSDHANDSGQHTPTTLLMITKSCSLPNLGVYTPPNEEGSLTPVFIRPCCRSYEDLGSLVAKGKGEPHAMTGDEKDNNISGSEKDKCSPMSGGCDSYNLISLEDNWTTPGMDSVGTEKILQGEPSVRRWDELPSKEFKIKRIEEWVSTIDLNDCTSPFEEPEIPPYSTDKVKKGSNALGTVAVAKLDTKIIPAMEAAKNYISSLTATSTTAQLTNLGLAVIPYLSAFVSLRVLNLSGNAIVRITSGSLPRGLHMLNLSKNNISTIEGLRELTRLRILDLSYNRIFRIGHGLASCSSLKELYLSGNKISEVEGLHRLLKLNILDLRFNKISTAKCLGQLAANYSSLQAISLEGNPAQRNVGDEQLKKYLQGLLPHLVYFNRQPIKAISSKEVADRPTRSAITGHKFDSALRSEHKLARKGLHSIAASHKPSSSSHGRTSQVVSSPKRSRSRHGHLPPNGTRAINHRHHHIDLGNKLLNLRSDLSLHRSKSEGNLGAS